MFVFTEFLTNIRHTILKWFGLGPAAPASAVFVPPPEPGMGKIHKEPLVAFKDGHLVVVFDHIFKDVPNWVEWDEDRHVLSVMQIGGRVDEVLVGIDAKHYEILEQARKLLLVSNDNNGKDRIVHYIQFVAREYNKKENRK